MRTRYAFGIRSPQAYWKEIKMPFQIHCIAQNFWMQ